MMSLQAIRGFITENVKTEGELRSEVQLNIKRLMDIGMLSRSNAIVKDCQCVDRRPRTNARTRKGKKKTVAGKKKATK